MMKGWRELGMSSPWTWTQGEGFVDNVAILDDPSRFGFRVLVLREYRRVAEGLDLKGDVGWVQFNRARNGMKL